MKANETRFSSLSTLNSNIEDKTPIITMWGKVLAENMFLTKSKNPICGTTLLSSCSVKNIPLGLP